MENHPSLRFSASRVPASEVAYVADNEGDAQALARQMGGLVEIRCRIVEEVPFRRRESFLMPRTSKTSETFNRPSKAQARSNKKNRL